MSAQTSTLREHARQILADNDAYHYLAATGDLLITGPARTNVMDVRIVLAG